LKGNVARLKEIINTNKIIVLGFVLAFLYMVLESIIDTYVFRLQDNPLQDIFTTDLHEQFVHITIIILILFISFYSQKLMTKQIRTQQKLSKSEELYFTTLKSIGDAVITTDRQGIITFLNYKAEITTGWKFEEALGRPIIDVFKIINEITRESVENPVARVIKEGIVVGLANHSILIARDGSEIPIDDSGAPINDESGNPIGVVLVFHDITERKKAEEAEKQALMARQEKLAMLGQLAGGVGHELRNPLGAIKNAVYFLKMVLEEPEKDIKETLDVLDKEVEISESIINSLLGFARPKAPLLQKADINHIIQEVFSRLKVPENVDVVKNLDETLPSILVDPDQLTHVFGNILLNAIQAMGEGGQLIIKTEVLDPGWITISISDTGTGISKGNLKKLFEPLYTTKAKGIGLGLAISKIIVEGHEGEINVQSKIGKGSTFMVILPIRGMGVE